MISCSPAVLPRREDRERLLTLLERLENDERVRHDGLSAKQRAMLERVRKVLGAPARARRALPVKERA